MLANLNDTSETMCNTSGYIEKNIRNTSGSVGKNIPPKISKEEGQKKYQKKNVINLIT